MDVRVKLSLQQNLTQIETLDFYKSCTTPAGVRYGQILHVWNCGM